MRKVTAEAVIAGTVGALAMMPAGFVFRLLEMRVGHYGPKFAGLYLAAPGPAALFLQHIVLGWVSAVPLSFFPLHRMSRLAASLAGAIYGALYYVLVNALALPLYFADPLPWRMGWPVVVPSLVVHLVFGVAVALAALAVRSRATAASPFPRERPPGQSG